MAARRTYLRSIDGGRKPRRRSPAPLRFKRPRGGYLALGAVLLVTVVPPLVDAGKGLATPTTGCRVWQVVDGDTVKLLCPATGPESGRLLGFDTPELFSPQCTLEWVQAARAFGYLRWRIWTAHEIGTQGLSRDRYDRRLVTLRIDGEDIADDMIARGLARPYAGERRQGWCL